MTNPNIADIRARVNAILAATEALKAACIANAADLTADDAPECHDAVIAVSDSMEAARAQLEIVVRAINDVES